MLFCVFRAVGPISIPTPPTVALTEFFHADWLASIPCHYCDIWYPCYVCVCDLECILCLCYDLWQMRSAPVVVIFSLRLNVTICIVCLHFSNFRLSSVDNFSAPGRAPFFLPVQRAMRFRHVVWVWFLVIFRWLFLFSTKEAALIDEQQ